MLRRNLFGVKFVYTLGKSMFDVHDKIPMFLFPHCYIYIKISCTPIVEGNTTFKKKTFNNLVYVYIMEHYFHIFEKYVDILLSQKMPYITDWH